MTGRTADSQIVVCGRPGLNYSYYYRGVRLSDSAPSEFSGVEDRRGGKFVVVNGETTYTVTPQSLRITSDGQLLADEPMIEYRRGS